MEKELIEQLFDKLDAWRNFPAYQLERRADIFFALYLQEILEKRLDVKVVKILPEFPVRVGDVSSTNSNKSFKIDYMVVCEEDTILLVELKTDVNSLRATQHEYLTAAKKLNIKKLVSGVKAIFEASYSKEKYSNYLKELADLGWLSIEDGAISNTSKDYRNVKVVYIQPVKEGTERYEIITFDEIIEILNQHGDFLTKRFLRSLEKWKRNPNRKDP